MIFRDIPTYFAIGKAKPELQKKVKPKKKTYLIEQFDCRKIDLWIYRKVYVLDFFTFNAHMVDSSLQ